jgi:hypothetical protein
MKTTTARNSFTKHPFFAELRPFMYLNPTGSHGNVRIQLRRRKMSTAIKRKLSQVTAPCVACGAEMHPLRNGRYFAATCPLTANISCSRTARASMEYFAIQKALAP